MKKNTYTITAALPYANGPLHIGHLAGAYLPADIYARYKRMLGAEVAFISGSDEGGAAITLQAYQQGITPQQLVDRYHSRNKASLSQLGISFDIFFRTSSPRHHQLASSFFSKLAAQGILQSQTSKQYYDEEAQFFLADRYIIGRCPHCQAEGAYGDQCEKCGSTLSPQELLDPRSKLSGSKPVKRTSTHWYLPLDKYQAWLKEWILQGDIPWKDNVRGQCRSWLNQPLRHRAITRDLDWGVPVPLPEAKGKVLYVWFEAPIGYISATMAWAEEMGKDWKKFWKDSNTKLIHFAGKDNIVFHCIIFPTMLHAHGGYILPHNVPANEFMNLEGQKISTSRNHAIWLEDYLQQHPGEEDALRYAICSNLPETKDSNFTWKDFVAKNNNELVAILGNFVHRTLSLTHSYFEGKVPAPSTLQSPEHEVYRQLQAIPRRLEEAIESYTFRKGLQHAMELARVGNKYLATTMPWKRIGEDRARTATIIHTSLQIVAHLGVAIAPFLPFTAAKIYAMLQCAPHAWEAMGEAEWLPVGHAVATPTLLFNKKKVEEMMSS